MNIHRLVQAVQTTRPLAVIVGEDPETDSWDSATVDTRGWGGVLWAGIASADGWEEATLQIEESANGTTGWTAITGAVQDLSAIYPVQIDVRCDGARRLRYQRAVLTYEDFSVGFVTVTAQRYNPTKNTHIVDAVTPVIA